MSNEKIKLIERTLKSKDLNEFEILFVDKNVYETIFMKNNIDNLREVKDFEYFIRILSQKNNETGIGVVQGNSLEPKDLDFIVNTCISLSKANIGPKYTFPGNDILPKLELADKKIIKDPLGVRDNLSEELITEMKQQDKVIPTFARFRIHSNNRFLKNSNGIDYNSSTTFFFLEFSIKALKNGKQSEFWDTLYLKDRTQLQFKERVKNWAKYAMDTLDAREPVSISEATVIFPPSVLVPAMNKVVGFHALGRTKFEKLSRFNTEDQVASEEFTMIDDGILKGGLYSNPWDGEGVPHQTSKIIDKGIFKMHLNDRKYGSLNNEKSTGNGMRSINGTVINHPSNLEILPGNIKFEKMVSEINEGFIINQFSWLNPDEISGSFGAEIRNGYYIKNGEIAYPIKGGNVSGRILEMIKHCQYISKEREYTSSTLFPYIAFNNLDVSS